MALLEMNLIFDLIHYRCILELGFAMGPHVFFCRGVFRLRRSSTFSGSCIFPAVESPSSAGARHFQDLVFFLLWSLPAPLERGSGKTLENEK